jgi:hypothetical protein
MNEDAAAKLAEKIAGLLRSETQSPDLAALFASLEKINHRLDKLEARNEVVRSPGLPIHPSQERLTIAEAIVDNLFEHHSKEKACTFEPRKPCDHCSMCNSRGF